MGKKTMPLVSVLMPVYNGGLFLSEAIESVLRQDYKNFEFLIADNGSRDNSWDIIERYRNQYSGIIRSYRLKNNRGAYRAINFLFPKAKGEFIALMDSDDVAGSSRFARQVGFLMDSPGVIVLGCQANVIDRDGLLIGRKMVPETHSEILSEFGRVHPMIHPSCMIRKSLVPRRKYLYDVRFGVNSDYYTFFEFLKFGRFANLPETLLNYRIHVKNSSLVDLKSCFWNTVKIRLQASKRFGYQLNFLAWLNLLAQILVVSLTPNQVLFWAYLFWRGIFSPGQIIRKLLSIFKLPAAPVVSPYENPTQTY